MPGKSNIARKQGVICKNGTAVTGEWDPKPIHYEEGGVPFKDGTKVSYYYKYFGKECRAADVREVHTKPAECLTKEGVLTR